MDLEFYKEKNLTIKNGLALLTKIASSPVLSAEDRAHANNIVKEMFEKLDNVRFKLGIIGEFNAGKSTLLNSLLGQKISATGDRPCTPVPVYISYSDEPKLIVEFNDGKKKVEDIEMYEKYTNYDTAPKDIKSIILNIKSDYLKKNQITLIDTPGINAINEQHTQITESVVPELNAAILLVYSKQPGSKSTIEFLKKVSRDVNKIFICVSKSDFLNTAQLERIESELPRRLSTATELNIPKVYPIHITNEGAGEDFGRFLDILQGYMTNQWYEDLSKDLNKILYEYSLKIDVFLENKMMVQEKVFYEYVQSKPTDFSSIEKELRNYSKETMKGELSLYDFDAYLTAQLQNLKDRVSNHLRETLKVDKVHLGFIDKRVDKDEIKKAIDPLDGMINGAMGTVKANIDRQCNNVVNSVKNFSKEKLESINDALSNFDKKMLEALQKDEDVINAAKVQKAKDLEDLKNEYEVMIKNRAILEKLGLFVGVALSLLLTFTVEVIFLSIIPVTLVIYFFMNKSRKNKPLPDETFLEPDSKYVEKAAREKQKNIETHTIPSFSLNANMKISKDSLTKNNFFLEHEAAINTFAKASFQAGRVFGFGMAGGIIGVGLEAVAFFAQPKAKKIYKETMDKINEAVIKYREAVLTTYKKLPSDFEEVLNDYINSLPERYKKVLEDAFNQNKELIAYLNSTIVTLQDYSREVKKLSQSLDHKKNFTIKKCETAPELLWR